MLLQHYEEHGKAFLSRTVAGDETWVFQYTPESKAESMTWKHPHSPVKKKFQDSAVSRESDGYCFLDVQGVLLVDFTPPGSTVNVAAYRQTLKRLKEAIQHKRPGFLPERLGVLHFHDNARPHSAAATLNLLNSWG
jgi:hypothetical protein